MKRLQKRPQPKRSAKPVKRSTKLAKKAPPRRAKPVRARDFGVPEGGVPVTATEKAAHGKPIGPDNDDEYGQGRGGRTLPAKPLPAKPPLPISKPPRDFPYQVVGMPFLLDKPPREVQASALAEVKAAFDAGKRFVILEGPPGVGKTACAMTLAAHFGTTYVLTVTKLLQAQYLRDFEQHGARELKGRSNFKCARAGDTCDVGGTLFQGEEACGISEACPECPYRTAKRIALSSWATICNYSSYLYNIGEEIGSGESAIRELLVCDEAHDLESVLMDFVGVSINVKKLPVLVAEELPPKQPDGRQAPAEAYFAWLEKLMGHLKAAKGLGPREQTQVERLQRKLLYLFKHRDAETWIVEPWNNEDGDGFDVKPLTVSSFGSRLYKYGKRVLLMSATILDAEQVAQNIGIPNHEFAFIQAPCIFPKENRPIYVGALDMRKDSRFDAHDPRGGSWPRMVDAAVSVLRHHARDKGLILTPSIEMLKYLQSELSKRDPQLARRLILAYGKTRVQMYEQHLRSREPTVLAAAGFWEGVDLKDDCSRWQLIPALPRPLWQGQVAARATIQKRWYKWRYMCQLAQGVGRSVRHENDSAVTYVLDNELRREMDAARRDSRASILPQWLLEACHRLD